MKSLNKIFAAGVLILGSHAGFANVAADASGKLTFVNNTGETIKVTVNGNTAIGVPIPPEGKELDYSLVRFICAFNQTACLTEFFANDIPVGKAVLNTTDGSLVSYEAYAPYTVNLNEKEVPLRTVTLNVAKYS